ncbi:hypothetical protein DNTS_010276 [Danionella cerebrum]|uniref:F-box domain-containing protein n=1 Tax=Danionella cerebrum TaxID=2873325 RepID=A0A553MR99_9TELE|nr:hypothetical protein DNTS_010276 [Danionella translucida]
MNICRMAVCISAVDGVSLVMDTEEGLKRSLENQCSMSQLPEEVLEYILSFLSPYQEHKTAALVCKQWNRLIKGFCWRTGSSDHPSSVFRVLLENRFLRSPQQCVQGSAGEQVPQITPVVVLLENRFLRSPQQCVQGSAGEQVPQITPVVCSGFCWRTGSSDHSSSVFRVLLENRFLRSLQQCVQGVAYQCYHGFLRAVQEGNITWESRTYPYPGTPITQRFSHSACYCDSNQSMYVFGGCTQSSCNAAFNDLWRLDLNSKEWIRPLASGSYPSPKAGATLVMSNEVWVLDLEQWSWSKPSISGPSPHPRGGQSQIVMDDKTLLILGGCGGPNALLKDAWLLHMSTPCWWWQQLTVENEDHAAPELWCHPACKVGDSVVVFSQATSGRAPLSPSLGSRPSPLGSNADTVPPSQGRAQSPGRSGASLALAEEAPCVNGRWGTLRPPAGPPSSPRSSAVHQEAPWDDSLPVANACANGLHTSPRTPLGTAKMPSSGIPPSAPPSPPPADSPTLAPIARRLAPNSSSEGKPLYPALSARPMQMYLLDVSSAKAHGRVSWRVLAGTPAGASTSAPPETGLHSLVQGRGELIIFGGLTDKKQSGKFFPKTNALYFVRAKR